MRALLLIFALPFLLALVALGQQTEPTAVRVTVVDSLAGGMADLVVSTFEADLSAMLARDGRTAVVSRLRLDWATSIEPAALPELAAADLVVSFGRRAADRVALALAERPTPHLFAYVSPLTADRLTAARDGLPTLAATGIAGRLPRLSTISLVRRLLASREAHPLSIGLLHLAEEPASVDALALAARAAGSPVLAPIGVVLPPEATPEAVVAAVLDAIAGAGSVDAYWLALEPPAPIVALVRGIVDRTGKPVLYAHGLEAVAAGALMSLVPEPGSIARDAAALAKRLLDGAAPQALPVQAPSRIDLALNLATADRLGIVPSHELLELARGQLYR